MQIVDAHGVKISFCLSTIADEGIAYQRGHIFVGDEDCGEFSPEAFDKLMDAIEADSITTAKWDDDDL